jgi:hypothetical protein
MRTEEQQKFYDKHKSEMAQPETIRLREILIVPEKPVDKPVSNASVNNAADPGAAAGDNAKGQDPANDAAAVAFPALDKFCLESRHYTN